MPVRHPEPAPLAVWTLRTYRSRMRSSAPNALLSVFPALVLGCGSASPIPPAAAPPEAAAGPLFVTVGDDSIVFHRFEDGALRSAAPLMVHATIWDHAWRGPDELVVLDEEGHVLRIVGTSVTPLPEPPASAWTRPPGLVTDQDPEIAASDYETQVALAGRGQGSWKGRCLAGAMGAGGVFCTAYSWLRLLPLDASRTVAEPPDVPAYEPAAIAPAAGVALERVTVPATEPDEEPSHRLICRSGATTASFPDGADDMFDRYGTEVYDVAEVRWLAQSPPTYAVQALVPGLDFFMTWFAFSGCSSTPIARSPVEIERGPDGWYALNPINEGGWIIYQDGREVMRLRAYSLMFAPRS